jgi:hypothetical protein
MAKKKTISTADLKKLVKEAYKLDPQKPMPKAVATRMDDVINKLAAQEKASRGQSGSQKMNAKVTKPKSSTTKGGLRGRGGGAGGAFLENLK